jgi:hypothetical protein
MWDELLWHPCRHRPSGMRPQVMTQWLPHSFGPKESPEHPARVA